MSNTTNNSIRKNEIRVRIAPSPTGIPHIGNTRTALFNFLFARHNNGKFIVRIEDTDRARLVDGAEKAIYEILEWLGIMWDEKYKQSERIEIYKKHAEQLLEKGVAYKEKDAIRFEMPKTGETFWNDLIGDKYISFKNNTQEDFIIIKSDGFPTYNFANVIDDHLMEITHVIRGEEFISSMPKHIQLYKSFGWKHPFFAHLPIVLGPDKTKLSKRHGAKSVLDYRDEGFLKEALINFMVLLGWNPGGNKEIMDINEMIKLFDVNGVNAASPIFDIKKLEWMNGEYIRMVGNQTLKSALVNFYKEDNEVISYIESKKVNIDFILNLAKTRMKTLADFKSLIIDTVPAAITPQQKTLAQKLIRAYEPIEWKPTMISGVTIAARNELNMGTADIYTVLMGKPSGLPFEQKAYAQGKENIIDWLKKVSS